MKYKYIVCYYDEHENPMQMEVRASSREDAFESVEQATGRKAICEKWELMDQPKSFKVAEETGGLVEYPRPCPKPEKGKSSDSQPVDVMVEARGSVIDRLPRRGKISQPVEIEQDDQPGGLFLTSLFVYDVPFFLFGAVIIAVENQLLFGRIEELIPNPFFLEMCMCVPFILFPLGMSFVIGAPIILSPAALAWLAYAVCKA